MNKNNLIRNLSTDGRTYFVNYTNGDSDYIQAENNVEAMKIASQLTLVKSDIDSVYLDDEVIIKN